MAETPLTVQAFLHQAQAQGVARLDAMLLLGEAVQQSRTWLIAHSEYALTPIEAQQATHWLHQRAQGVPLAYLLGRREFHGLMLQVTPAVLDPRPDTETLVDWALEVWPDAEPTGGPSSPSRPLRVLDLGTGSGAIALALKAAHPLAQVHACDASPAALEVAQNNATSLGLPLTFHTGHWWGAVHGLRFDLAVANPPYIREDDPHLPALVHEPASALVAGQQGLADLWSIIEAAPAHLEAGAWLLLEHGHDQASAVAQVLVEAGFVDIAHRHDLSGHTRCTGGRLPR